MDDDALPFFLVDPYDPALFVTRFSRLRYTGCLLRLRNMLLRSTRPLG